MDLLECADVVVEPLESKRKGISGGQLRRLSIAIALLKNPSILILGTLSVLALQTSPLKCLVDEPTSGLDSNSTLDIVKTLSRLSHRGHTILVSIHQPRIEVFELFSKVIIVSKGEALYHGSPSQAPAAFKRLARQKGLPTSNMSANPADFILDVASELAKGSDNSSLFSLPVSSTLNFSSLNFSTVNFSRFFNTLTSPSRSDLNLVTSRASSASSDDTIVVVKLSPAVDAPFPSLKVDQRKPKAPVKRKSFREALILNLRWWAFRPYSRKYFMFIVASAGASFLAFLERRPGHDLISFNLQVKGLLLGIFYFYLIGIVLPENRD